MNISMHQLKLAGVIAVAVALGACSKNPTDLDGLNGSGAGRSGVGGVGAAGAASPGSTQDFVVNVGDRIFFDSDSSEINGSGQATLDKQARWLNQYASYAFTVEGHADERGTREYNFALGARRAEATKNYLDFARRLRLAHQDDLLWQGAPGGGVRRHLLLVAKSPRRDGAQAGRLTRFFAEACRNSTPRRRIFVCVLARNRHFCRLSRGFLV